MSDGTVAFIPLMEGTIEALEAIEALLLGGVDGAAECRGGEEDKGEAAVGGSGGGGEGEDGEEDSYDGKW